MEKIISFHLFIFLVLWLATPIFDHAQPKKFQSPFNLCEIIPACKKSFSFISSFLRYSWFYSSETRLATHSFLTMPQQKHFNQLLIFVNLYHHAKNEAVSLICSGEMFDLKIPQSEWLRAFQRISQNKKKTIFGLFSASFPSFGVLKKFSQKILHAQVDKVC